MKEKKYIIDNAELMAEWNWEKNNELKFDPNALTLGSNKKVWWKCSKGHEWQASIGHRTKGRGCPYCSGRYAIKGENDLQTVNPTLAKEWNYEKNNELTPAYVLPNSDKKVWWKCSKGHEWQASISHRSQGRGCPYCSGRKTLEGYNDLQSINPAVAKEWNYEKNNGLTPTDVTPNSDIKAWWTCSKGHEWQATIGSRHKGSGCPYCSGRKTLKGYNDLQSINPAVAKEWNYERNGNFKPEHFTASSNKKVWWKCSKGHEWQTTINSRNDGCGCPVCSSERKTSFPEYAIVYYLKKHGLEAIHTYKEKGYELDVFIPSKKVAIEYDGYLWHKNRTKQDLDKNLKCLNDGIKLYRIREGLHLLNDSSLDYVVHKTQKDLSFVLEKVLSEIIGMGILVDLNRDAIAIENLRELTEKESSLLFSNPEIAKEWNHEKNGNLKPEHFASNSNKKVWWKCSKGHEWQSKISHRNNGSGCPYCSGQKSLKGYNDLQTANPILAKEWNYEKNGEITPNMVTIGSTKKVWWKCDKGHEWQASINNRSIGRGCPYCSGRYAIKGENDLQTVNPSLANEWNCEKNNGLTPADVLPNSDKKVWWKCSNGHEWQATIGSRNKGSSCPICRKKHSK
ncbi:MAG: hypothetical protein E7388_07065 [Ruminococcaceae bacterium]|nr:hypothetical protein [Oscillospiraceae bacterium]